MPAHFFFRRTNPDRRDTILAEALELIERGTPVSEVLSRYPSDADWLTTELDTALQLHSRLGTPQPRESFEGTLRAKVLHRAQQARREPEIVAGERPSHRRLIGLTSITAASLAVLGTVYYGAITADDAESGDWNYLFAVAGDRIRYATANDSERLEQKVSDTQERVADLQTQLEAGEEVDPDEIARVMESWLELEEQLRKQDALTPEMRERLTQAAGETRSTLQEIRSNSAPELVSTINNTLTAINDAVAAGANGNGNGNGNDMVQAPPTSVATPPPTSALSPTSVAPPPTPPSVAPTPVVTTPPATVDENVVDVGDGTVAPIVEPPTVDGPAGGPDFGTPQATSTMEPATEKTPTPTSTPVATMTPTPTPTPTETETPSPTPTVTAEQLTPTPTEAEEPLISTPSPGPEGENAP